MFTQALPVELRKYCKYGDYQSPPDYFLRITVVIFFKTISREISVFGYSDPSTSILTNRTRIVYLLFYNVLRIIKCGQALLYKHD